MPLKFKWVEVTVLSQWEEGWISYEIGQHVLWFAIADIGRLLIFQVEGSFESEDMQCHNI